MINIGIHYVAVAQNSKLKPFRNGSNS
jgi:hypothetical protein